MCLGNHPLLLVLMCALADAVLQCLDLTHHLRLLSIVHALHLVDQSSLLFIVLLQALHLLADILGVRTTTTLSLLASLRQFALLLCLLAWHQRAHLRVDASEMLIQVLLTRETLAGVSLAVQVGAVELFLRSAVLAVNFALMTKQAARVGKSWELLTAFGRAFVWSIVLVHVLAVEC